MKRQLEFQKASVIAQYYFEKQGENGPGHYDTKSTSFSNNLVNQQKFDQIIADAKSQRSAVAAQEIPPEQLNMLKQRSAGSTSPRRRRSIRGSTKNPQSACR
jgi:hypothetical protein